MDAFCCILLVTEDPFSSIWSKSVDFTPPRRSTPASGLALLAWKTRKNNSWGCSLKELDGRRAQLSLLQSRFLLSIPKLLSDKRLAPRRKSPHPPPLPNKRGAFHLDKKSVKFGEKQMGCVRLGNLDLDFKIRISDLQSNAKSEKEFQRWDICFWILIFTVRLRNPKKDLKSCP